MPAMDLHIFKVHNNSTLCPETAPNRRRLTMTDGMVAAPAREADGQLLTNARGDTDEAGAVMDRI